MSVALHPFAAQDFPDWRAAHVEWYVGDLHENGGMQLDAARRKADGDMETVLPLGLETPGHSLLAIEADGERVGSIWFALREDDGGRHAYLFAIEIDVARRGRGYGRAAMLALEGEVRARGVGRLSLNVFGGNERARSLYRSLGFSEVSVHMDKELA